MIHHAGSAPHDLTWGGEGSVRGVRPITNPGLADTGCRFTQSSRKWQLHKLLNSQFVNGFNNLLSRSAAAPRTVCCGVD
ncbi:hypothetical protein J6590_033338 [Homalodisca vitripennis]|nr:hypothetical protein J6590_033338 [Homalodisca vitripennis]